MTCKCCFFSPKCAAVVEVKESIHDTVRKAFESVITLNDVLMSSPNSTTVVEVKEKIYDTIITNVSCLITANAKTNHI